MASYALVNKKTKLVENIVEWDGVGDLFSDFTTVEITDDVFVMTGSAYNDGKFTGPDLETPEMTS